MELNEKEQEQSADYLSAYERLIGDERTRKTFNGTIYGIIGAESLRASQIAQFSPELATVKYGERSIRRLAGEESTKRSQLDADSVTQVLREVGVANLLGESELTLVLDGMELRRAGSQQQEHLMRVKALDGSLVNGYRSFNVLGMGKKGRGLLYHHLFSSQEPEFQSENVEIDAAIDKTEQELSDFAGAKTWVIDQGFDSAKVWWKVWGHPDSHLVNRVYHHERIVLWEATSGHWEERYLEATFPYLRHLADVEAELEVRLQGQKRARVQKVTVQLSAVPLRVFHPDDKTRNKAVWLVRAKIVGSVGEPWYLLTDWPVTDAEGIKRIFVFYRRRWAVEDTFKFIKTAFGIEEVQVSSFTAIRNLVAYGWVAAGFLFHLGLTLEQPEVRLLAILGGWEQRENRPPGKLILTRGLRRLIDQVTTQAILQQHILDNGDLPPFVKRLLETYGYQILR